jgi:hypothetical protein
MPHGPAGGREAARHAAGNPSRAIAVLLDHSATPGCPSTDCPAIPGVPMFLLATYSDMFQDLDRRKAHFFLLAFLFVTEITDTILPVHTRYGRV